MRTDPREIFEWTPVGKALYRGTDAWIMAAVCVAGAVAWPFMFANRQAALVMSAIFGGAAIYIIAGDLIQTRRAASLQRRATAARGERWLWEYAWNKTGTTDRTSKSWRRILTYLIAVDGVLLPLVFRSIPTADELRARWLWVAGFAIANGWLLFHVLRRSKFGMSSIRYAQFPFRRGESVRVMLRSPHWLNEAESVKATLRCMRERIEERGQNALPEIVAYCIYEDTQQLTAESFRRHAAAGLQLEFDVPADAPETKMSPNPPTYWDLEIVAELPGVDYNAHFLIPLY